MCGRRTLLGTSGGIADSTYLPPGFDAPDVVGESARVGVLFADALPGLVQQEPVEDVGGLVDGGRDGLGGERGEAVGDVRVRLDVRLRLSHTNRVTPASTVSSSRCSRSRRSPGGTRSAMRASMQRSASTSASAQSRSIVVVAGRMVRVRRQASTNHRTKVLVRLRLRCFFAEPLDEFTRRAAREGPESVQAAQLRQMLVPGLGPHRVVAELRGVAAGVNGSWFGSTLLALCVVSGRRQAALCAARRLNISRVACCSQSTYSSLYCCRRCTGCLSCCCAACRSAAAIVMASPTLPFGKSSRIGARLSASASNGTSVPNSSRTSGPAPPSGENT